MITLRKYLYESLLDDEDDLVQDDSAIVYDTINNPMSMFYKEYNNKSIVKDPATIKDGHTVYFPHDLIFTADSSIKHRSIEDYLPGIDSVEVKREFKITPERGVKSLDGKYISPNITTEHLTISLLDTYLIKDINIKLSKNYWVSGVNSNKISINNLISREPTVLQNVTIDDSEQSGMCGIEFIASKFPKFKNVKFIGSGLFIKVYDVNLADKGNEIGNYINSLLDTNYKIPVEDVGKGTLYRKCDLKTIQAILNNGRRYKVIDKLFKLKSDMKMSDIFPDIPKGTICVLLRSNKVRIFFERDKEGLISQRLSNYSAPLKDGWNMRIIEA